MRNLFIPILIPLQVSPKRPKLDYGLCEKGDSTKG